MTLFQRKKDKRNALIIKDHVIRYIRARKPDLDELEVMDERYLPPGVIQEGRVQDEETLRQILQECADVWGLHRKPVQYCVPDAFVVAREVPLPEEVGEDEIGAYLYMEVGDSIAVPFDDPVFDYVYVPERHVVILLAAPRGPVDTYAGLLESLNCRPNAADISSLCFYRALAMSEAVDQNAHTLLVLVDLYAVNISVFHEGRPLFISRMSLETEEEDWSIQTGRFRSYQPVWNGHPETLQQQAVTAAEEVERIMNFYRYSMQRGEKGIDGIFTGGDHPFLERWTDTLAGRLDIPVKQVGAARITAGQEEVPMRYYENAGLVLKQNIR
ncbi:type IV pilus biogenesis protein PilM [Salibacterium halotolerans]|uniref:Type IV pilus assembly protein PilM n=1 Tax=Salibacterium halotolerans TaxID=1884432 RepID=A0A1I5ST59_9BACI|nr:pilus assembly protein PilM [Salibacterium halotolerans]SFP73994.1 type IV pilus assembly protein PilM [Salibacterium halotolerans]